MDRFTNKVAKHFGNLWFLKFEASIIPNIGRYVFSGQQALQIYSNYLDGLNKPNTNPILQGSKQEQS